jgi:hypothetical protein
MKSALKATRPPEAENAYPSPAEVERMCFEIQSHWSARDRQRRTVITPAGWSAPTIKVAEISRDKLSNWAFSTH